MDFLLEEREGIPFFFQNMLRAKSFSLLYLPPPVTGNKKKREQDERKRGKMSIIKPIDVNFKLQASSPVLEKKLP